MAVTILTAAASNAFNSQPATAGEQLILRSTAAADVSPLTVTAVGSVASTSTAEAIDLSALASGGKIEQQTTAAFETLTLMKIDGAPAGTVNVYGQGTKGSGYIIPIVLPANNTTLLVGLTGFYQTYTYKTALTGAANEILIGADLFTMASNIFEAINNGTVADANNGTNAGTNYGTGTARNAYVSAYSTSAFATADLDRTTQTTVYLRDRLATSRQLTWVLSTTAASFSLAAVSGGADGTLLAQLTPSVTQIATAMSFSSPALASTTLLAATTPTTDAVRVYGKTCTLHLRTANITSAVTAHVETAESSAGTWTSRSGTFAITSMDNNEQFLTITDHSEFVRVVIDTNANTTDSAVHMALIF